MMTDPDTLEVALQRLEASAYEHDTRSDGFAERLGDVGQALGFSYFCLVETDRQLLRTIGTQEAMSFFAAYEGGGWAQSDTRYDWVSKAPADQLFVDHRDIPEDIRKTSAIYNDFFPQHGLDHFICWRFRTATTQWFASLTRPARTGAISTSETDLIATIRHRANRVFLTRHALQSSRHEGWLDGLRTSGDPLIGLGENGRVIFVNPAAERLLGPRFAIKDGRLWAEDSASRSRLQGLADAVAQRAAPPAASILVRIQGRHPILLQPTPVRGAGLDMLRGVRTLIVMADLADRPLPHEALLRQTFRLSPAEADIARHLAAGLSPAQAAEMRGVARDTVRGQLKSLMQKMDVHRQGDVGRIVERLGRFANAGQAAQPGSGTSSSQT
jgi:DNA-binding CsgD family transcriptional regulator/PAS domain-containing protein